MTRLEQISAIDGMTDAFAAALVGLGLDTYWEIHRLRAETLVSKIEDAVGQGLVASSIDTETAVRWQKSAVRLSLTRFVDVQVQSNRYRQPLAAAVVKAGDVEGTTDDDGYVRLAGVRVETTELRVSRSGYFDLGVAIDLRPEETHSFQVLLARSPRGSASPVFASEYEGDLIEVSSSSKQRLRERTLEELPEGAVLLVARKDGTARLVSLMREKDGRTIYTDRVEVPVDTLPAGTEEGQLLEWSGAALRLAPYTRSEFTQERAKRKFGFGSLPLWPRIIADGNSDAGASGPVALPEVAWNDLAEAQRQQLIAAVADHPDGLPLNLIRSILGN